jgi:O-antigen/teichoic acid export membrane protein
LNTVKPIAERYSFLRQILTLASGTVLAQIVMVAAVPVLTRLYTPEQYGKLAIYLALVGVLTVNASLRYQFAIPLAKTLVEKSNLTALCLMLVLMTSFLVFFISAFCKDFLFGFVADNNIFFGIEYLLPLSVFAIGAFQVLNYYNISLNRYGNVTLAKVFQSVSIVTVQFIFNSFGVAALIFGQVVGQALALLYLVLTTNMNRALSSLSLTEIKNNATVHRKYPIFETWSGFLNVAGVYFPVFFIGFFFASSAVGQFSLTTQVLTVPITIISDAVSRVFLGRANKNIEDMSLEKNVISIVRCLFLMGFPFLILIVLFGKEIFVLFFGKDWAQAGDFAMILAPWLFVVAIVSCISNVSFIFNKQQANLYFQMILFLARLIAMALGAYMESLVTVVALFSAVSFICWCCYFQYLIKCVGISFRSLYRRN